MSVERLRSIFAESLGVPLGSISDDLECNAIPQWDSIAHVELIVGIERAYGILIGTDDVSDMRSFRKAREIVAKYGVDV